MLNISHLTNYKIHHMLKVATVTATLDLRQ